MAEESVDLNEQSYVHVSFAGIDSTKFGWNLNKVTPLQLIALAQFMEIFAKNMLLQSMQEEDMRRKQAPKIVQPGQTGVVSADEARALWGTLDK
jgi:hypothetical protein